MTVTNILQHSTLPHFCIHLISVFTLSFPLLHCLFTVVHHHNSDCTIIVLVSSIVRFVSSIVACEQLICWLSSNLLLLFCTLPYHTCYRTLQYIANTGTVPSGTNILYCTFYCTYRHTVLYSLIPTYNPLLFFAATLPFLHSLDLCFHPQFSTFALPLHCCASSQFILHHHCVCEFYCLFCFFNCCMWTVDLLIVIKFVVVVLHPTVPYVLPYRTVHCHYRYCNFWYQHQVL